MSHAPPDVLYQAGESLSISHVSTTKFSNARLLSFNELKIVSNDTSHSAPCDITTATLHEI